MFLEKEHNIWLLKLRLEEVDPLDYGFHRGWSDIFFFDVLKNCGGEGAQLHSHVVGRALNLLWLTIHHAHGTGRR